MIKCLKALWFNVQDNIVAVSLHNNFAIEAKMKCNGRFMLIVIDYDIDMTFKASSNEFNTLEDARIFAEGYCETVDTIKLPIEDIL